MVSETCGVPVERLLETDGERMLRLEQLMGDRIVGHREALGAHRARPARATRAASGRSGRSARFSCSGPTGVGKTETAKAIAECLFHSPHAMTRLDFSEYAEAHAIARLVGAPPGYIGHDGGGQLTEAVRKRPYQVLLLDEIEKAHRDVLEAFLQVFDEGHLTDGRGRTVDFTNVVIAMTSNLGADVARPSRRGPHRLRRGRRRAGRAARPARTARRSAPPRAPGCLRSSTTASTRSSASRRWAAPTWPRSRAACSGRSARTSRPRAASRSTSSEGAVEALLDEGGFDAELGARPMRRAIGRLVEAPIAEMILKGELDCGDVAMVDVEEGGVAVDAVRRQRVGA